MRIYIDLDSLSIIDGPGIRSSSTLRFKRGTAPFIELQFGRVASDTGAWTPETLDPAIDIRFGLKEVGKYDADFIVFEDGWTLNGYFYEANPSFNTTEVNTLLGSPDANVSNDVKEVTLMGEVSWRVGADLPNKTKTFEALVENAVDNGDESAADDAGPETVFFGQFIVAQTTRTRTSTTTPTVDEDLVLALKANRVYAFELFVPVTTAGAGNWKGGLKFPTTPSWLHWSADYSNDDSTAYQTIGAFSVDQTTLVMTVASTSCLHVKGAIKTGANAGNIALWWSQNVSNGTATQRLQGSWMRVTEIPQ